MSKRLKETRDELARKRIPERLKGRKGRSLDDTLMEENDDYFEEVLNEQRSENALT